MGGTCSVGASPVLPEVVDPHLQSPSVVKVNLSEKSYGNEGKDEELGGVSRSIFQSPLRNPSSSPRSVAIHPFPDILGDVGSSEVDGEFMGHEDFEMEALFEQEAAWRKHHATNADSAAAAELLSHTALSLEMEGDDLLYNLWYFQQQQQAEDAVRAQGDVHPNHSSPPPAFSLNTLLDTIQTETLALHSADNTPYKLHPAAAEQLEDLSEAIYMGPSTTSHGDDQDSGLCLVCRDDLNIGDPMLGLPTCHHTFHKDCLLRWLRHQAWCPICRTELPSKSITETTLGEPNLATLQEGDEHVDRLVSSSGIPFPSNTFPTLDTPL